MNAPEVAKHLCKTDKCPTKDAKCYKCQRTENYRACCYARQISAVIEDSESTFLGAIKSCQAVTNVQWLSTIVLKNTKVVFRMNIGAEAKQFQLKLLQFQLKNTKN